MTTYSQKLAPDYVRTYRTMLQNLSRPRLIPKESSNTKVYMPSSTVSTTDASSVFFPLFYAGEKGALGIWDKRAGVGAVKRRLDDDDRSYHVLELSNPRTNLGTYIATPKSALNALHITLPHFVMTMKNYRRNFAFEVLIMDSNAYRRRFSFATWYNPSALKKFSFMCQVPLRLEIGWNEIHVDFNELVKSTYKTQYVETIRIQIYANCKLRQIFFCDERIIKGEIPIPSMRDFGNIRIVPLDYGPRTHPDGIEPGPEKKRNVPYVDPPAQIAPSRLEQDLKSLQRKRYTEVSKQRLMLQPYKTYFRELLHEEKQYKKMQSVAKDIAQKAEAAAKAEKAKSSNLNIGGDRDVGDSNALMPLEDGISSLFNPKGEILAQILETAQKEKEKEKSSPKLAAITEEKEIKAVKTPSPKPNNKPSPSEEKANVKNNNIPNINNNNNNNENNNIESKGKGEENTLTLPPSGSDSTTSSQREPSLLSFKPSNKSPPPTPKSKVM